MLQTNLICFCQRRNMLLDLISKFLENIYLMSKIAIIPGP